MMHTDCTAILVKDWMENVLEPIDPHEDRFGYLWRSAKKAMAAGVAGATLTNPFDVIRNEMFKTDKGLVEVRQFLIFLFPTFLFPSSFYHLFLGQFQINQYTGCSIAESGVRSAMALAWMR
jgi:hypothetical protein